MSRRVASILGLLAGMSGWYTAAWFAPFPWAALAVAYATVVGGRSAGTVTAVVSGFLLGVPSGTAGLWMLALTVAVVPVDRLHRETLTHRTPAAPVLLGATAVLTALPTYWIGAALLGALREPVVVPSIDGLPAALGASLLAAAGTIILARSLRTLGTRILHRVR